MAVVKEKNYLEKTDSNILKCASSAGTKLPIWAIIRKVATCDR